MAGRALDTIETLLDSAKEGVRLRAAATILKTVNLAEVGMPAWLAALAAAEQAGEPTLA